MDRQDTIETGIEDLGVASVETRGDQFPVPEQIGYDLPGVGGISVD